MSRPATSRIGEVRSTEKYGDYTIVDEEVVEGGRNRHKIKFKETGFEKWVSSESTRSGLIKDPTSTRQKKVYGAGYNVFGDFKAYTAQEGGKKDRSPIYIQWTSLLQRCYSDKFHDHCPSYRSCTMQESWKDFQIFAGWYEAQSKYRLKGWHLDKDLLLEGNRIYGEEFCVFLPREINSSLDRHGLSRKQDRGLPSGVRLADDGISYEAVRSNGKRKVAYGGRFKTVEEALNRYYEIRKERFRHLAEKYKENLDPRAYNKLLEF